MCILQACEKSAIPSQIARPQTAHTPPAMSQEPPSAVHAQSLAAWVWSCCAAQTCHSSAYQMSQASNECHPYDLDDLLASPVRAGRTPQEEAAKPASWLASAAPPPPRGWEGGQSACTLPSPVPPAAPAELKRDSMRGTGTTQTRRGQGAVKWRGAGDDGDSECGILDCCGVRGWKWLARGEGGWPGPGRSPGPKWHEKLLGVSPERTNGLISVLIAKTPLPTHHTRHSTDLYDAHR